MNSLSPLYVLVIYFISYFTAYILKIKYFNIPQVESRFETVDGLRGFLALSVFVHHSSVWYQFIGTGNWIILPSNLMNQLGQTSVTFFFMITSFLFVSKLLKSDFIDFKAFIINRIYRLVPMYLVSLIAIFIIVLNETQFSLRVSLISFITTVFKWVTFTVIYAPINNFKYSNFINAGITWSLPYEWLFYLFLPLIYIAFKKNVKGKFLIIIFIFYTVIFYKYNEFNIFYLLSFLGGGIAAMLVYYLKFCKKTYLDILILCCLGLIGYFNTNDNYYCIILSTIIFILIAMGNSIFGILKNNVLKYLGEISYSTYLIHGIIMYVVFNNIIGIEKIKMLNASEYSILIFSLTPIVILLSVLGYHFIEKKFIDIYKKKYCSLN